MHSLLSFGELCDIIDLLATDTTPHSSEPVIMLKGGTHIVPSPKALNGKFDLYLYNKNHTQLVDQRKVANAHELIAAIYEWDNY